ncbi:MAG: sialate O-acetylesterase [Fuerstiella sp.]|nr:sialate O-acetylesterase [Fuerstiella sp.]MCP4854790.1 sialate O-acetylesterase [Fuerstiella sp.]
MKRFLYYILLWLSAVLSIQETQAEILLPVTFGHSMVLQRDAPLRIFGKASKGAEVTVEIDGQKITVTTSETGRWKTELRSRPAGGPYELIVSGDGSRLSFKDVMIGEVWLAGGQSNMAAGVQSTTDYQKHLPAGPNPQLRFLKIPVTEFGPINTHQVAWQHYDEPESALKFSAVAYFFAAELQKRLGVTVGIIGSYRGGTWNENWMTPESIKSEPELRYLFDEYEKEYAEYATEGSYENAYQKYLVELKEWQARGGWSYGRVPFAPIGPRAYQRPSGLYQCMIQPLQPYSIKGVIWYQGEGNSARHEEFRTLFPAFVRGWRKTWENPDLPFYFVQLPPFKDESWPHFRQAQLDCAKAIPNCGMVVSEGCGDLNDIHPKVKKPIGIRLANAVCVEQYGHAGPAYGPIYQSVTRNNRKLIITFNDVGSGLVAKGPELTSFEIAGKDKVFVKAYATIVGNTVEVSSNSVPVPEAVRYAYKPFPVMDLFNKEGLPASPFMAELPPPNQDHI